jgi:hypothetical protein
MSNYTSIGYVGRPLYSNVLGGAVINKEELGVLYHEEGGGGTCHIGGGGLVMIGSSICVCLLLLGTK